MGPVTVDEKIDYRTIGGMTVVLLLLLGYLVLIPPLKDRSGPVGAFITEDISNRQVSEIVIKTPDGRNIQYGRDSGQWQIQKPYRAYANQEIIRELLDAVKKTRVMDIVEEHPENLSMYGLEEGQRMDLALKFEDGIDQTFHFGARLPLNQIYVYFQREGDPAIFRVWEGIRLTLEKYAKVLDQGQPVQFEPSAIVSFEVLQEERTLRLEKRGDDWFVTHPVQRGADNEMVRSYLASVLALKSSGMAPPSRVDQKKSLDGDTFKLTLTGDKENETITVRLAQSESHAQFLLSVEQDGVSTIFLTGAEALDTLSIDPNDFSLPFALSFENSAITNIRILHPRFSVELQSDSTGVWRFYEPYTGQMADANSVGQLLHLLKNLPVEQYLAGEERTADAADPDIVINLSNGTDSTTLTIVEDPAGQFRGTSEQHPGWFRLDAEVVKRLQDFTPEALVDRHLLVFDPRSVEQVIVRQKENEYLLTRKGSGWEWERPYRKKARNGVAWKLVFGIRDIQYQKLIEENEAAATGGNRCSMQDPDVVIEVKLSTVQKNKIELKGIKTKEGMILSTGRFPGCYQVEQASVDNILSEVTALVDGR
jgi:hypothetical protein